MSIADKVAIITGGASGIGRETVWKFVQEGARVAIADVNLTSARDLAADVEARGYVKQVIAIETDVGRFSEVQRMIDMAVGEFGRIDILFNNAGVGVVAPLLEHDPEKDYDPVVRINQNGVYYGILAGARQMIRQGSAGVIINTSSIYGSSAADAVFTYCATKAAVISFSRSAALELAQYNIRVVAIAPGRVQTPILAQFSEEQNCIFASEQLRGRLTHPREIADVVAFLASDQASAINGTVVHVDDGYSVFKNR